MSDIFISYAREDRAKVKPLAEALARQGWKVWWDPTIPTGRRFHQVIDKALNEAQCVVVVWTSRSVEKDWVLEEAQDGRERDILIPVFLEKVRPPRGFRLIQAAELFDWDGSDDFPAFQALLNDIAGIVGPSKVSVPPPAEEKPKPSPRDAPSKTPPKPPRKKKAQPTRRKAAPPQPKDLEIRESPIDGLEYVWIPPGTFQMGAVEGDAKAEKHEKPQHRVTISKGLWLAKTPVTVAAYESFAKDTKLKLPGGQARTKDHPVVKVTWDEAVAYCKWAGGRLPAEAEWEYAARGGKSGLVYPWGNAINEKNANYDSGGTSPVGSYPANGFGLYDMAGNVWEWCSDWYKEDYYSESPGRDPQGPSGGQQRVMRGGSRYSGPEYLPASYRSRLQPDLRYIPLGFRCVREVISPMTD